MADQDQPLVSLRGYRQQLGANRFGVFINHLLRTWLDEVDGRSRHAPCAELLDILQKVSGHLLVEEAADEDIAIAARVSTDFVRNLQPALARSVEPGAELLGRDARSGLGLDRRDEAQGEKRQEPEHGKLLRGKVRD